MARWTRRAVIATGVAAGGLLAVGVGIPRGELSESVAPLVAGDGEQVFDIWLTLAPDNGVTAIVPHAEMGQGVHTSLAMMLADELDADWEKVSVREAPATRDYANYALARGYLLGERDVPGFLLPTVDGFFLAATRFEALQITGGSLSVRTTGRYAMRIAGAAAREMLVTAAADAWAVPRAELLTRRGELLHAPSGRRARYADFAERAAALPEPPAPRLKAPDEFTLMGTSPPRLDVPPKVDGTARFGIDVALPGMRYAAVRAAPVFGARVDSIATESVQDLPGVRRVVDLGDAVAVVADGYWQAEQALRQLDVRFTASGNESVDQDDIYRRFADSLERAAADDAFTTDLRRGDAPGRLAAGGRLVSAEYRVPYLAHATMEPMNCTAVVADGRCELWLGTQNPLGFAKDVAGALDLDIDDVRVHNQYLGGGFGRRAFPDFAIQAARIAREAGTPVKLIWSREEDMRHDHYRQANVSRFRALLDDTGRPQAWENSYVDKHDPEEAPHIPYAIENQLIRFVESPTHVPWGFWRSVDHSLHAFFTESFIDELAVAAGQDPYRYRRALLAGEPRFRAVLDLAAERSGWDRPLPAGHGRGIAIHRSFGTIVAQVVEATVEDGRPRVQRVVCAVDAGFAVHPDGLRAQMESGIVYGLTAALYGEISIRGGAVRQGNFHDYPMLRIDESPLIETHIVDGGGPLGGAGEPGTPAIAPALANAVYAATGIRVRELPFARHDLSRPERPGRDIA